MGPEDAKPEVAGLLVWDGGGREEMEDVIDIDGVGVLVGLFEDVVGDRLAKRSVMLDAGGGATG